MGNSKRLLVRTPQTVDGTTLQYDEERQVVYSESIVELGSKKNFESLNASLPEHLRHDLSEIEVDDEGNVAKPSRSTKKDTGKASGTDGTTGSTTAANATA